MSARTARLAKAAAQATLVMALCLMPAPAQAASSPDPTSVPAGSAAARAETSAVRAETSAVTAETSAAGPGYLTILLGRTQLVQTTRDCKPKTDAVSLFTVAADLAARGRSATGNVVVSRTGKSQPVCVGRYTLHPTWADLASLRDTYGRSFVSAGGSYADMTTMTSPTQWQESCGSLSAFTSRGHLRAHGLFAYPNNKYTTAIQREVVSTCFAFGRQYAQIPTRRATGAPYFQKTWSVNGGKCADPVLPCATMTVRGNRSYTSPDALAAFARAAPDQWTTIQYYRFVTGTSLGGTSFEWDCGSPDWRAHWTSDPETYCYQDFLKVVDAIPAEVVVTDPLAVATAWGRTP